jgi:transposase
MDTSKHIFQLHGVDAAERPVLRRQVRRKDMVAFFAKLPATVIGMEACGASHYWARELGKLGHEVRLIAPQHVKPYVKRNKNDGRDAEGLCEAMSRPTMRFVAVKTAEQQAALMLAGIREGLIARRTQLGNMIRGYAAEFGVTAAKGLDKIEPLLAQIAQDESVPALARELFTVQGREYAQLQAELKAIDRLACTLDVPEDTFLCREGEPGKEFFVLVAGTATMDAPTGASAILHGGAWFGEVALMRDAHRQATVKTRTAATVMVFNRPIVS